jgi:hypothetical protein
MSSAFFVGTRELFGSDIDNMTDRLELIRAMQNDDGSEMPLTWDITVFCNVSLKLSCMAAPRARLFGR